MHRFASMRLLRRAAFVASSSMRHFTTAEFAATAPMIMLRQQLERSSSNMITVEQFHKVASACGVEDPPSALDALKDAAAVMVIDESYVHLRPVALVQLTTAAADDTDEWRLSAKVEEKLEALKKEELRMRGELVGAIARASRWRKSVWGAALLFQGMQLAVISRLTFFDFDWDVMEPVSYFLGTGTAIFFYFYLMFHHRDHSYADFDLTYIPKRVRKYAPRTFDWPKYDTLCAAVKEAEEEVKRVEEWARKH